jgi:hypothetical protein
MRTHAFSVPLSLVYLARRVSLEEACDVGVPRGSSRTVSRYWDGITRVYLFVRAILNS